MGARPAEKLSIAIAQLNSTVGDIAGNVGKVRAARAAAAAQGADIVVFPELFIAGYPPEDLLLKPAAGQPLKLSRVKHPQMVRLCWSARPGWMPATCTTQSLFSKLAQLPR